MYINIFRLRIYLFLINLYKGMLLDKNGYFIN